MNGEIDGCTNEEIKSYKKDGFESEREREREREKVIRGQRLSIINLPVSFQVSALPQIDSYCP